MTTMINAIIQKIQTRFCGSFTSGCVMAARPEGFTSGRPFQTGATRTFFKRILKIIISMILSIVRTNVYPDDFLTISVCVVNLVRNDVSWEWCGVLRNKRTRLRKTCNWLQLQNAVCPQRHRHHTNQPWWDIHQIHQSMKYQGAVHEINKGERHPRSRTAIFLSLVPVDVFVVNNDNKNASHM